MISVCVPYWERQEALDLLLGDLARLYPHLEIEVSVCDDGSPEPCRVPPGVILTRLPAKDGPLNPCVPINRAVEASSGDVIVLTNPEVRHRDNVLDGMLDGLDENTYIAARCWDERWGRWLAHPDLDFTQHGRLPVPPGAQFHFLAMLRRPLWERAGGFDEDYRRVRGCDDNDFLWRLHRAGARFRTTEGVVYHDSGRRLEWGLPHGRDLFAWKWPEARLA